VAIAAVHPVFGAFAVGVVAELVDIGGQLHHLAQQVASDIGHQILAQQACRAHRVSDFHRIFSFVFFGRNLKFDAVVIASGEPSGRAIPGTPLGWTQLPRGAAGADKGAPPGSPSMRWPAGQARGRRLRHHLFDTHRHRFHGVAVAPHGHTSDGFTQHRCRHLLR
jgi:hypothetical protein